MCHELCVQSAICLKWLKNPVVSNLFHLVDALAKISDNTTFPKLTFMCFLGFSETSVDVGSG